VRLTADETYIQAIRETVAAESFFERAALNDRNVAYPHESMAALKRLGVPGMLISPKFGGPGHNALTMARAVEEIAYGDPTSAACMNMHWVVADILAEHAEREPAAAFLLQQCAANQDMFSGGASVPSTDLNTDKSGARFRRVPGGWRGGGRVGFATNSGGATFIGTVGAVLEDDDSVKALLIINVPKGTPGVTVLQDWRALGLRGSTTNTIVIEDAFLSDEYCFEVQRMAANPDGPPIVETSALSVGHARSQISKGAMWMGHCRRIRDYLIGYISERSGTIATEELNPNHPRRTQMPWAQACLGQLEHWISTGQYVIYQAIEEISDESMDPVVRAEKMQLALYHMRRMCEEVLLNSFRMSGAHGIVEARPLERMYRDLMAYIATAYKAPELVEHIGKAALGMPFKVNASGG
jgi:alkylation response protein AidB-like acyl-CoA dehydrogenase